MSFMMISSLILIFIVMFSKIAIFVVIVIFMTWTISIIIKIPNMWLNTRSNGGLWGYNYLASLTTNGGWLYR